MNTVYLIDFDGTITQTDTLDHIAKRFFPDKYADWWEKLKNKEYTIKDWLESFEASFNVKKDDYDKVLEEIEIDPTFADFARSHNCAIVSGGFVYNIKKVLGENIEELEITVYANDFEFIEENKCKIEKSHFNEICGECGVCKTDILKKYRDKYQKIVFIGDGITDICVAQHSDEIYAKKGLYLDKYLTRKNVEHKVFEKFSEIY